MRMTAKQQRIKAALEAKAETQADIARRIGTSQAYVSRVASRLGLNHMAFRRAVPDNAAVDHRNGRGAARYTRANPNWCRYGGDRG